MTDSTMALHQNKLRQELKKILRRRCPKPPNNFNELNVLVLKILQFVCSCRIGFDLAATSSSEVFLSALGCLLLLSIFTYSILWYLYAHQREKLPYFLSKISSEVFPPSVFIGLFVIATTLIISIIAQKAGAPRVFIDILTFNMLAVLIIGNSLEVSSFQRVYRYILSILLAGMLLGIIFSVLTDPLFRLKQ